MFEAYTERRLTKLPHNIQRRIGVLYVVIRQLFSMELASRSQRKWYMFRCGIELGILMRVFTVAQALFEIVFQKQFLIQSCCFTHVRSDAHIIFCCMGISLGAQFKPGLLLGVSFRLYFTQYTGVVIRITYHRYVIPVLGCRAKHGRTADINFLNCFRHGSPFFGNRLAEWIQINAYQVNQSYSVLLQSLHVRWFITACQ